MKLLLWSIGKEHEPYVRPGVEDFTRRLSRYYPAEWTLISPPKGSSAPFPHRPKKEGRRDHPCPTGQRRLPRRARRTRAGQLSSEKLAAFIQTRANSSSKNVVFLIGGAFGLDTPVLERADFKWSLSQLTLPHQLVRLVVAEQLYRACTILRNEKYHHA